jgi:hypothetical protein
MTQTLSNVVLLDEARAAILELMARMDRRPDPVPQAATGPTLAPRGPTLLDRVAEQAAIHQDLVSASLLLDVSQTRISPPARLSPQERSRRWTTLVEQTKAAGRAVYGAALALTDPGAMRSPRP